MHDLLQTHNVIVVTQLLEYSDFPNGCARNPIVTVVNFDLLYSDCGACRGLNCLVYDTVGALTQLRLVVEATLELFGSLYRSIVRPSTTLGSDGRGLLGGHRLLLQLGVLSRSLVGCCTGRWWQLLLDC